MENENNIVITRTFKAPRSLVFDAWTQPEHIKNWWAPKGFTNTYCTVDLRIGGEFRYCMTNPEGAEFWGKGVYKLIDKPNHIQCTDTFTDKDGNPVAPSHYGMQLDTLSDSLVDVVFEEQNNQTTVTITVTNMIEVGEEREMARQGWNDLFDNLDIVLAEQQ
ncbi:MAG: SRPBCC domain-containing protein [Bacteroidota bacterium]